MMQIEQMAESYEPTSRKTDNAEYGRLELYSLGTGFYTGLLGGGSRPLGGGLFGGGSIFDRMERLAESRPLKIRSMRTTEVTALNMDDVYHGLRLVEKIHPPQKSFTTPSYELLAGIKGFSNSRPLVPKGEVNLFGEESDVIKWLRKFNEMA